MKKTIVLMSLAAFSIINVRAQGLFINIDGGYGMSSASQNIAVNFNGSPVDQTTEMIKGSFGRGVNLGGKIGYMLNPNIGAEIGVSYLLGSTYKNSYEKQLVYTENVSTSARMLRLTPGLRFSVGDKKLKPYIGLGMVIGVGAKITTKDTYLDQQSNTTTENSWKYSGGVSMGVSAGLGINYSISDRIGVFAEIRAISQSWAAKKGERTNYTVNGTDMLSNLTTSQKEINYGNSYVISSTMPSNSAEPDKQIKNYKAFSSVGFNLGISFSFIKK